MATSQHDPHSAATSSSKPVLPGAEVVQTHAMFLGQRLDVRQLPGWERISRHPLTVQLESGGIAILFRYGVVVFFNASAGTEQQFIQAIQGNVVDPYDTPETERLEVRVSANVSEGMDGEICTIHDASLQRLQIVATILSRSVVLAEYENRLADSFDLVEQVARNLKQGGQVSDLLRHLGSCLLTEVKLVGRVEVHEKPELLWDRPTLEPLYLKLEGDYEIIERQTAIDRKVSLISRTVRTVLELIQQRHTLRVEWYIVFLIVVEIILACYDIFWLT
jgi:uncharacterized Rmd1/YagE family protein